MERVIFLLFAAVIVGSAASVIFSRNIAHSAFSLVITLFGVACLYIMLQAEFLAAAQIIVYAGAVMVLFIFTLMLININQVVVDRGFHKQSVLVMVLVTIMIIETSIFTIPRSTFSSLAGNLAAETKQWGGNTEVIGHYLLTEYLFPFELASVVLLVAVIASVFIGKGVLKDNKDRQI